MRRTTAAVERLRIEVAAPDSLPARHLPERISRLYHEQLAALLDEEFARYCPGPTPRLLAQLTVVVPPVVHSRLDQDLPSLLRQAVRAALAGLPAAPVAPHPGQQALDLLGYFLRHGAVPWHISPALFVPDETFRQALRQQPGALRMLLSGLGPQPLVRKRLAGQLTAATLDALITLLEPVHAPFMQEYVRQILASFRRVPPLRTSESELRRVLVEYLLASIFERPQVRFNPEAFLARQLGRLAAHYGLDDSALLRQLMAGMAFPAGASVISDSIKRLAQKHKAALGPAGTPHYAALLHFLRHASLTHHDSERLALSHLITELDAVLQRGRPALLRLLKAAGPQAAARTLARHFPPAAGRRLMAVIAPTQVRPLLELLETMIARVPITTPDQAAYRQAVEQQALYYHLLRPDAVTPLAQVRRWLDQQVPLPPTAGNRPARALPAHADLFEYLLFGFPAQPGTGRSTPATLRRGLRTVLQQEPKALGAFLRQHAADHRVLRHLVEVADFAALVQLAPLGGTRQIRFPASQLKQVLGSDEAGQAPENRSKAWLREAYLFFYLRAQWVGKSPPASEARLLLARYHLPARATHVYLQQLATQHNGLRRLPFFAWLLAASAVPPTAIRLSTKTQPGLGEAAEEHTVFSQQRLITGRTTVSDKLLQSVRSGPPPAQMRLAGAHSRAEIFETVRSYLLRGAWVAPALRRALFRRVLAEQVGALHALLRRYGAARGVWTRVVELASFAELAQLVAGAKASRQSRYRAIQPALAALDSWSVSTPLRASAGLVFLKTAYLAFHFQQGASGFTRREARQLAAAHGLPWKALLVKIAQFRQHWPALVTDPFFSRVWGASEAGFATNVVGLSRQQAVAPALLGPSPALISTGTASSGSDSAAREALLYYLLHGQAPWWQPVVPSTAALRLTLGQRAHRRPLQNFFHRHARNTAVLARAVPLADFSLVYELTVVPGASRISQQVLRPALSALDRVLQGADNTPRGRFRLFLRQAYWAFALNEGHEGKNLLATARQQAAAAGLSWHGVLVRMGQLLRRLPALAAAPFFAALLSSPIFPTTFRPLSERRRTISTPRALLLQATSSEAAEQALEQYLQTGYLSPADAAAVAQLLQSPAPGALALIRQYLGLSTARLRLAAVVPASAGFLALLRALYPAAHRRVEPLLRDWGRLLATGRVRLGHSPTGLWAEVLALVENTAATALPAALVQALVRGEKALRPDPPAAPGIPESLRLLRVVAGSGLVLRSRLPALLAAQLAQSAGQPAHQPSPPAPAPKLPRAATRKPPVEDVPPPEGSYVINAGLVLLWPFFTLLFDRLGYLEERRFRNTASADRAVQLLHFLGTGEERAPEHLLLLNKLLCGIAPGQPVARELVLTDEEKDTGTGLLRAVLSRWEVLQNTSIAGLRETFLQRAGKLAWRDDRVLLVVETKTVDILLDQCPWSIALVKLPWMALPLYITWR